VIVFKFSRKISGGVSIFFQYVIAFDILKENHHMLTKRNTQGDLKKAARLQVANAYTAFNLCEALRNTYHRGVLKFE
jgi:hypothetical protein